MGGDHAPDATIHGAILAAAKLNDKDRLFLFGDEELIRSKLEEAEADINDFEIVQQNDTYTLYLINNIPCAAKADKTGAY